MLERLEIHGFQKNRHRVLTFDNVTFVCGRNGRGKSGIVRALRWLTLNKPNGTSFISWGEDRCKVRAVFDGRIVTRSKGPKGNTYQIGSGEPLKAVGTNVPDPVQDLLKLSPLNFQNQHDGAFLFSLSPGRVAEELNQVVDLAAIDRVLSRAAKKVRKAKAEGDVAKARLREAKKAAADLSWVPEMDADLRRMEELELELEQNRLERARIARIMEDGERVAGERSRLSYAILDGSRGIRLMESAAKAKGKADALKAIIETVEETAVERAAVQSELGKARRELEKLMAGRCPLCGRGDDRG